MSSTFKYLFHMVHDLIDFRLKELESIGELFNKSDCVKNHNYTNKSSLFSCELDSNETAQQLASRSVLLKSISNLYYQSDSIENLLNEIQQNNLPVEFKQNDTFKIEVYTFGKIYTQNEKLEKIERLVEALKFTDDLKVCLNDKLVTHRFIYAEEWIVEDKNDINGNLINLNEEEENLSSNKKVLRNCYFGKFLCNGQNHLVNKFNLKERCFIANTSMDPLLSLIMSNMAHVEESFWIYDPFVGSGSLLISAAYFGAHVSGADLDYNLIHSRGLSSRMGQKYRKQSETIRNNLKQYGLENKFLDVLVADFSSEYIRKTIKFDAIITDPPYGIREKAKKIGNKSFSKSETNDDELQLDNQNKLKEDLKQSSDERSVSFPQQTKYLLGEIFEDLIAFASFHLIENARLVFWLPIYLEKDRSKITIIELNEILKDFIPTNEYLDLICFSEQRLTKHTSRILVTMKRNNKKICDESLSNKLLQNLKLNQNSSKSDSLNQFREKYFTPLKNKIQ